MTTPDPAPPPAAAAPSQTPPPASGTVGLIAVALITLSATEHVQPGQPLELPAKEADRLLELGLARRPGEGVAATPYDESIKADEAKVGEGKAAEADARAASKWVY